MSRTIVHLLRHGEVYNPDGILYGCLPGFGLSEYGQKQALLVADRLATHELAHVVASPLQRAQETAQPIADAHGVDVDTDEQLVEASNMFEGMRFGVGDGALRRPEHWPKLRNPRLPSWGEPYKEIAHRMLGAIHRARANAAGQEALCVSHQLPIWTVRRFLESRRLWHDPRRRQCSLASLTSVVFSGEEIAEVVYSEPAGATDPTAAGA